MMTALPLVDRTPSAFCELKVEGRVELEKNALGEAGVALPDELLMVLAKIDVEGGGVIDLELPPFSSRAAQDSLRFAGTSGSELHAPSEGDHEAVGEGGRATHRGGDLGNVEEIHIHEPLVEGGLDLVESQRGA